MWQVETLIQGYPGKSKQQGGLGWSTVALARGPEGRIAVLDTGRSGARRLLVEKLAASGVAPTDVTDVLITHLHYDHCENWSLFPNALIHVPGAELDWAAGLPDGAPLVPEFCVRALAQSPRHRRLVEGSTGLPGISCFDAPGHSPHHMVFVLEGAPRTIFSSDVAKNRAELATGRADITLDAAQHKAAIARLNAVWREQPGTVLLPGHDVPLRLDAQGMPEPLAPRVMTIEAWFGDSLEDATRFDLT
ncbi:MBL fold metallo-hydrolase [Roseomonas frigidaquae]|uniref:MBL fold metallo-hydrolase n=1 Tax=Falsiroseomonas frigidaquae TaxID=487318 RepID=A0ABX1F7D4_9PROT|nr:MBL fold metallo-hydrolase [Falsiroseomonas frigidaquae]NKE48298.1 MBL fold metallo-hydrolase [Falsiroseomonas frigidaquae]